MRRVCFVSLLIVLAAPPAVAADIAGQIIDIPCSKNLVDGRVLVDGKRWDEKMRDLGYVLDDDAYVPYQVLAFTEQRQQDQIWADGLCRVRLLPVTK